MATKKKQRLTPRQEEWKREIKNLKARISTRRKLHLPTYNIVIPEMPNRVTQDKIEELKKLARITLSERKTIKLSKQLKQKREAKQDKPQKTEDFFGVAIDTESGDIDVREDYEEYEDDDYDYVESAPTFTEILLSNALNKIDEIYDTAVRDMLHSAFLEEYNKGQQARFELRQRFEEASYLTALQGIIWYRDKGEQYANAQSFLEVIRGEALTSEQLKEVGQVIDESKKMKFGTFKSHKIHNVDKIEQDIIKNGRIRYSRYDKEALKKVMAKIVNNPKNYTEDTVFRANLWLKMHE